MPLFRLTQYLGYRKDGPVTYHASMPEATAAIRAVATDTRQIEFQPMASLEEVGADRICYFDYSTRMWDDWEPLSEEEKTRRRWIDYSNS